MKILLTGGCKSGKSRLAQHLAARLSRGRQLYYLATMVPQDEEDWERIRRHVAERAGLCFRTIECGEDFAAGWRQLPHDAVFLLDSLTALLAHAMFPPGGKPVLDAGAALSEELALLSDSVADGVFVSDGIFCDSGAYDALTEGYRSALAALEQAVASRCDGVAELCAGIPVVHAGAAAMRPLLPPQKEHAMDFYLLIGGAGQGKTSYAKKRFRLEDADISCCSRNAPPDFSRRCIVHLENYVSYCLAHGMEPDSAFPPGTVLVCDDIFCGIVPVDAFERAWRERTGRFLQELAARAHVTRIFCGIGEDLQ